MQSQSTTEIDRVIEGRPFGTACLIAAIIGGVALLSVAFLLMRTGFSPGPKEVSAIPDAFPAEMILYRPEQITQIYTYPSSSKKSIASFALAPLRWLSGKNALPPAFEGAVNSATDRDTTSFAWTKVASSTPDEIFRFYVGAFKEVGLSSPFVRMLDDRSVIEMIATSTVLNASLVITDQPGTAEVDTVTLIVDYPSGGLGKSQ